MLEINLNDVTKNFGFQDILRGASLEINSGDRVAIVGRNGSGKTTILKLISGEELPTKGAVHIRSGATIGYLEQIPDLQSEETTTREILLESFAELLSIEARMRDLEERMAQEGADLEKLLRQYAHQQDRFESLDGYAMQENMDRIISGFGLEDLLDRPFNVLSGGQKTIVSLARTILSKPDILLLDEPTNHLDIRTLEWFEDFLSKYKGTVVMVSHDRYFLDKVALKTILLEHGACQTFHGNYSFSLKERERQLLIEFAQYKTQQKKIDAMKAAIRRYRQWGNESDNEDMYRKAKELEKRLAKMEVLEKPDLEPVQLPIAFSGGRTGRDALKLTDVSLSAGDLRLLDDVNFTLLFQERACLMGDNGTGKTTLVRAILGELAPDSGQLQLAPSAKVGYIAQEIRFSDDKLSMVDAFREEHICTEGQARNILAGYGFYGENVFKRVSALSGGEKVLLKLAILAQKEINFLILDEPTNHVDIQTREILEDTLQGFQATILFVSHDRYFIRKLANRILTIQNGTIDSFTGDYDTYREHRLRSG